MKRLCSCLLILTTVWMATWLVTDVHVVHAGGDHQAHPLFSGQGDPEAMAADADDPGDGSCHFCSYDHGGHVGGMALPPEFHVTVVFTPGMPSPLQRSRFVHLTHPPAHRPPIV